MSGIIRPKATLDGGIVYRINFRPGKYRVDKELSPSTSYWYYKIINHETLQPIAFAFEENNAKLICMALELVNAQVTGDDAKATELMRLMDKLRDGSN